MKLTAIRIGDKFELRFDDELATLVAEQDTDALTRVARAVQSLFNNPSFERKRQLRAVVEERVRNGL